MPFYAEALSQAVIIHKDLDNVYKKKKEEFYTCAKESEFYDCSFAKEGSLLREEYFKKSIGILSYAYKNQDEEILLDIWNLFKKGYRKTYLYWKNVLEEAETDINDYMAYIIPYARNYSDDELNSHVAAAIFFSGGRCKNIEKVCDILTMRWQHRKVSLDSISDKVKNELNEQCKRIPANILDKILLAQKADWDGIDFVYDFEGLSSLTLFNEVNFSKKDIQEVVFSLIAGKEDISDDKLFQKYVFYGLHIKGMCKAYKYVKEMYFQNNKETMYVEIESIKKEAAQLKSKLDLQVSKAKASQEVQEKKLLDLIDENKKLEGEIRSLLDQITAMESDAKEVVALREYFFGLENDYVEKSDNKPELDLNNVRGILVGGHPEWQSKMKEKLTQWKIIGAGINTMADDTIRNCELVIFNTGYLNHSLYYKIIEIIRNTEIKLGYISATNIDVALNEIKCILSKQ